MSPWESFFSSRISRRRSPIIMAGLFHRVSSKASEPLNACGESQKKLKCIARSKWKGGSILVCISQVLVSNLSNLLEEARSLRPRQTEEQHRQCSLSARGRVLKLRLGVAMHQSEEERARRG